ATSAVWHEAMACGTPAASFTAAMSSTSWAATGKPASRRWSIQTLQQPQVGCLRTVTRGRVLPEWTWASAVAVAGAGADAPSAAAEAALPAEPGALQPSSSASAATRGRRVIAGPCGGDDARSLAPDPAPRP